MRPEHRLNFRVVTIDAAIVLPIVFLVGFRRQPCPGSSHGEPDVFEINWEEIQARPHDRSALDRLLMERDAVTVGITKSDPSVVVSLVAGISDELYGLKQ